MNNKFVTDNCGLTFMRLSKPSAKNAFQSGCTLFVLTNNRNPIDSLTSGVEYTYGRKMLNGEIANTFNDILEDFSEWLEDDGFGHVPQPYKARKHLFSYWVKILL